jgi:hypothetical protein
VIPTFDLIFQSIWENTTQEINGHINNNGILANEQFGFCTKLSTETASYNLINKVLAAFNNKSKVWVFFLLRQSCQLRKS